MWVVEIEREGVRSLWGTFPHLSLARTYADAQSGYDMIQVRRIFPLVVKSHIHPGQTTIQSQIDEHVGEIHDHVN